MDYHFAYSQEPTPNKSTNQIAKKMIKTFLPVFALAAALPLFLILAVGPQRLNFNSKASQNELRIWFDPPSVVAKPGQAIKLNVIASNESSDKLVHSLKIPININPSLSITPLEVGYQEPFSGRVNIGSIAVIAKNQGSFTIEIDPKNVSLNTNEVQVITSPATITISNSIE